MPTSTSTRLTAIVAAGAVLLVIVGTVLAQALGGGEDPASSGPGDRATVGGDASAGPGACAEPPPLPESPPSFDEAPDKSLAENSRWTATVTTSCGDLVLELYGDKAPQTVSSFLFLARQDYWQDSPCHRLVPEGIYVLQCGDPTGSGSGGPGYGYGIENAPADGSYPRGTLAMARTMDPNSNGGQFFIVFDDTTLPVEGGGYSIFGRVVDGMQIVDRVAEAGVGGSLGPEAPAQPISILDVTVERAG